jgi:putative DNA-invertase from lambdoid prophage Rac
MSTVYGYVRVSSIAQVDGDSLDTQSRQIVSYAVSKGWTINPENIYVEAGVSGGTDFQDRQQGQTLLSFLKSGDTVVFTKLDRAFRNVRNAFNTLHDLKEQGVSVHFLDLGGEVTGNGVGAIVFAVMSSFASFERERIAARIREVKQMQKAQGKFVGGRRAFGYDIVDGVKVSKADEQEIIHEISNMKSSGRSLSEIQFWLISVKSIRFSKTGIREILLRNRFNI